ncbi:hypothetical protein QTP88_005821 [Uroleucon formosanum]
MKKRNERKFCPRETFALRFLLRLRNCTQYSHRLYVHLGLLILWGKLQWSFSLLNIFLLVLRYDNIDHSLALLLLILITYI